MKRSRCTFLESLGQKMNYITSNDILNFFVSQSDKFVWLERVQSTSSYCVSREILDLVLRNSFKLKITPQLDQKIITKLSGNHCKWFDNKNLFLNDVN